MRKFYVIEKFKNFGVSLPKRQTKDSAGYDLAVCEEVTINPGEIVLVNTGLKVQIPKGEVLLVFPRSSLGIKKFLTMANNVGVIDGDYFDNPNNEGHIMIPLLNFGKEKVILEKGERVAQGIFIQYFKTTDDDKNTVDERLGGFGSSG